MDEEGDTFDYENEENLEESDNSEGEDARNKAYETDSESEENDIPSAEMNVIEMFEAEIDNLNNQIGKNEITFENYNESLIFIQMKISDEKIKLMNLVENNKVSRDLLSDLGSLFENLKKKKKQNKFDSGIVSGTIDDIFRKYGQALEKELTDDDEFFFESNPITSDISNIINMSTPEKYQKQLQLFEQKIDKKEVNIENIYEYIDLRFNILNDNLQKNLKNDILYLKFYMDLQMEFASLRSELELLIGETDVVIDKDIEEINKKHGIKMGIFKSRMDILTNISFLKKILEDKISNLVKKYESAQETLFKKQDSKEVLKIFKQLREIYIKNDLSKLERRFTDKEIVDDFKGKSLDFIIEKYANYVVSDYFDWTSGKKEEISERPKYVKRPKLSEKEMSIIRITEKREYFQRKEFEKILGNLPKDILLKCADRLIIEGKINEPLAELTPQERYINDLYQKSIPIWTFSTNYSDNITSYAKEVDKMTDEFLINRDAFISGWKLGDNLSIGDLVYVDRTNDRIKKGIDEISEYQSEIDKLSKSTNNKPKIAKLKSEIERIELSIKSFNKYMRAVQIKGIVVGLNKIENTVDVKMEGSSHVMTYPRTFVSLYARKNKQIPLYLVADSDAFNPSAPLKNASLLAITKWIRLVLKTNSVMSSKEDVSVLYDQALESYKQFSQTEKNIIDQRVLTGLSEKYHKQFTNGIPSKGPLMFVYPPILPDTSDNRDVNIEEFYQYSKNLNNYIENLTPETNPFVKVGVPVTNELIKKIDEKVYPTLTKAIEHTPINGFFKLSSVNDFELLVLKWMDDKDKRVVQRSILSEDQIKEFYEIYFMTEDKKDDKQKQFIYKPVSNPKITLLNELRTITNSDEYIKTIDKIDKYVKISKIVGDEVFIDGKTLPITKINLEKMLSNSLEREYQQKSDTLAVSKNLM